MSTRIRSRVLLFSIATLACMCIATPAEAHMNSTGLGPSYDGLMHFLLSPEDIGPVLALALLGGLRGADNGRRAMFVLPAAWFVGGLVGAAATSVGAHPIVSACWFLLLGGLLAADAKLSLRATAALASLVGVYHGYMNGAGLGVSGTSVVVLLGLVFGVFVLATFAAAFVVRLRAPWARIGVRVAGSWIAAIGLLMLGWAARKG